MNDADKLQMVIEKLPGIARTETEPMAKIGNTAIIGGAGGAEGACAADMARYAVGAFKAVNEALKDTIGFSRNNPEDPAKTSKIIRSKSPCRRVQRQGDSSFRKYILLTYDKNRAIMTAEFKKGGERDAAPEKVQAYLRTAQKRPVRTA